MYETHPLMLDAVRAERQQRLRESMRHPERRPHRRWRLRRIDR